MFSNPKAGGIAGRLGHQPRKGGLAGRLGKPNSGGNFPKVQIQNDYARGNAGNQQNKPLMINIGNKQNFDARSRLTTPKQPVDARARIAAKKKTFDAREHIKLKKGKKIVPITAPGVDNNDARAKIGPKKTKVINSGGGITLNRTLNTVTTKSAAGGGISFTRTVSILPVIVDIIKHQSEIFEHEYIIDCLHVWS